MTQPADGDACGHGDGQLVLGDTESLNEVLHEDLPRMNRGELAARLSGKRRPGSHHISSV